jgi:hypothetical protein
MALRHDLLNGICLCASCHQFSPNESAHQNPVWFITWLQRERPEIYTYLFKTYSAAQIVNINDEVKMLQDKFDLLTRSKV